MIGVSNTTKSLKPKLTQRQKHRRYIVASLFIVLFSIFGFLLITNLFFAAFYGALLGLFLLLFLIPSDKRPKSLERIKRDADRRAHFIGGHGGAGKGLIHFEGDGPTPHRPEIDEEKYPNGVPPSTHGDFTYQGAYIFHISLSEGLILRGRITHLTNATDLQNSGLYFNSPYYIQRSLYIDQSLYTISNNKVKCNSLIDLTEQASIELL